MDSILVSQTNKLHSILGSPTTKLHPIIESQATAPHFNLFNYVFLDWHHHCNIGCWGQEKISWIFLFKASLVIITDRSLRPPKFFEIPFHELPLGLSLVFNKNQPRCKSNQDQPRSTKINQDQPISTKINQNHTWSTTWQLWRSLVCL